MANIVRQLVIGNRIFAHHGVLDAYGHLSIRYPDDPTKFIMSRARAPELVTEDDLMTFNMEGELVSDQDKRGPYQERYIHAAVYAARPDVQSVCHAHTESVIPFGVTDIPMKAVYHMGGIIGPNVPVWDIATEFGLTNMLVTNIEQGRSLARALGQGRTCLMRGHGCVFAGASVPDVVRHGVYMDLNARLYTTALLISGGKVHTLTDDEVRMRLPSAGGRGGGGGGREWEAWCVQVGMKDE